MLGTFLGTFPERSEREQLHGERAPPLAFARVLERGTYNVLFLFIFPGDEVEHASASALLHLLGGLARLSLGDVRLCFARSFGLRRGCPKTATLQETVESL